MQSAVAWRWSVITLALGRPTIRTQHDELPPWRAYVIREWGVMGRHKCLFAVIGILVSKYVLQGACFGAVSSKPLLLSLLLLLYSDRILRL